MALQADSVVVTGLEHNSSRQQIIKHFVSLTQDANCMDYVLHPFLNDAEIAVIRFNNTEGRSMQCSFNFFLQFIVIFYRMAGSLRAGYTVIY